MPRRVITAPGHSRSRSLGRLELWWLETFTVHGPGDIVGQPVRFGDEYAGFIADCYALDARGRRLYDSAFLSRPKGCDKSGIAGKLALLEAFGPARFAGWAKGGETYEFLGRIYTYAKGEAMGRAVVSPFVRILATEEKQTGNVYATIHYNLNNSSSPLFELQAYGVVAGLSEIIIPGGGKIVRSTAGAASKDGGLETFVVFDETHLYNSQGLREMYYTVKDNLGKRSKSAEPWLLEATTMYAPGEDSIAEETYNYADAIEEGLARRPRLLFDHRWGDVPDIRDEEQLAKAFSDAYGDALEWNPLEGLINGAYDPRRSETRTRRLFLNEVVSSVNAWIQYQELMPRGLISLRERQLLSLPGMPWRSPGPGDLITLGFDGSRGNDATALIGCRVADRHLFPLGIWETPDGPEADGYQVDREAVDASVHRAFETYTVVGFYADPPLWQDYVDAWAREFGDSLLIGAGKHPIEWWTNRTIAMSSAVERLHTAIVTNSMSFDNETPLGKVLQRHFINARNSDRAAGRVISKEGKNSPKKIDGAVGSVLAFEAAADYMAKKKPARRSTRVPVSIT